MTAATLTYPGSINDAADKRAMFLKTSAGLVINAFDAKTVMFQGDRHVVRNVSGTKTAQFPLTGRASASYHTAGAEIVGDNNYRFAERTINVDSRLISNEYIDSLDDAMTHFEYKSDLANKIGKALAVKGDQQLFQVLTLAARASHPITGEPGGVTVNDADGDTNVDSLVTSLQTVAQTFDESEADEDQRFIAVRPAQYYLLTNSDKLVSVDYSSGNGDFSQSKVLRVAGMELLKSNHIPSTNIASAETGTNNTYHGNFSTTICLVWQKMALGTIKLMDIHSEVNWDWRRRAWNYLAEMAVGHDYLNPSVAAEIRTATPV